MRGGAGGDTSAAVGGKVIIPGSSEFVIWHNPRCSKSRQTLAILRERGIEPSVREYLTEPPSAAELDHVLSLLGLSPRELMRRGEEAYTSLGLADPGQTRDQLIDAMSRNPVLIERPVVIRGNRAVLGRPPENVTALL